MWNSRHKIECVGALNMHFATTLCVFGIAASFVSAEICKLPNKEMGVCKPLYTCKMATKILGKKLITSLDEKFLNSSIRVCGSGKVCCPDAWNLLCVTPDGQDGECISLQRCPYLAKLRKNPLSSNDTEFIRNSTCPGPEENSVCCDPSMETKDGMTKMKPCDKHRSALPPDPDGGCCGIESGLAKRILGGIEAEIHKYPWLVVIEYIKLDKVSLFCGGTLISAKYVLTAGHCVKGPILFRGTPLYVRLGEYNTTNDGPDCIAPNFGDLHCTRGIFRATIKRTIPHPEYDPGSIEGRHDIALIQLKNYAPYTKFIRPICLPEVDYSVSPPSHFDLFVAGWGRYIQDEKAGIYLPSTIKRHVDVPYVPLKICQVAIRLMKNHKNTSIWDEQICAGGVPGKDSCKRDSGSPLMYEEKGKYQVLGIVSYGPEPCAQEGIPGVYTNVYKYIPWIKSVIEK